MQKTHAETGCVNSALLSKKYVGRKTFDHNDHTPRPPEASFCFELKAIIEIQFQLILSHQY